MDNRVTLPGYKYYLDPITRDRLALFVTFLNVVEDLSSTINGVLLPVRSHDLDSLDRRERNYSRLEVTDRVVETVAFRVWAYVGSNGARGRYETGVSEGTAVVDEAYYEFVLSRFRMLGDSAFAEFRETTDEPECPLRPLTRVNV